MQKESLKNSGLRITPLRNGKYTLIRSTGDWEVIGAERAERLRARGVPIVEKETTP
jgi:hypothetical protein